MIVDAVNTSSVVAGVTVFLGFIWKQFSNGNGQMAVSRGYIVLSPEDQVGCLTVLTVTCVLDALHYKNHRRSSGFRQDECHIALKTVHLGHVNGSCSEHACVVYSIPARMRDTVYTIRSNSVLHLCRRDMDRELDECGLWYAPPHALSI